MPNRDDRRFDGLPRPRPEPPRLPAGSSVDPGALGLRRAQGETDTEDSGRLHNDGAPFERTRGGRRSFVDSSVGAGTSALRPPQSNAEAGDAENSLIPRVELPRGGGALRSIGETFEANAFTGTGTLALPVPLSPARALTPAIELSYDSGRGNGPFGLGFDLSVPDISRRTDRGLPQYADGNRRESDTFVLAGAEDLVPVLEDGQDGPQRVSHDTDTHRVCPYRPRVRSQFSRIQRWVSRADGSAHWRVTSRDNVTSVFGETSQARVTDPNRQRRVFRWLLERQLDDRGNEVRYIYQQEDLAGVHTGASHEKQRLIEQEEQPQRYLKRVLYGNRVTDPQGEEDFAFEVVLDYGEHGDDTGTDQVDITPSEVRPWPARLDTFSSYRSRFDIRTRRLCRRILLFHRFAELSGTDAPARLVRSLDLSYDERPNVSLLVAATQRGYRYDEQTEHYDVESMPPVTLGYTEPALGETLNEVPADALADIAGAVGGRVRLTDLNGEGIPGLLIEGHDALLYKRAGGGGRYDRAQPLPARPTVSGRGSGSVQLMDIDGSGRMSVVQRRQGLPSGFWRRDNVAEDWESFREFVEIPTVPFDDRHAHFVDLDGDGIADFLYDQGQRWLWWESAKIRGWGREAVAGVSSDENAGPQIIYSDARRAVLFADMTGDGLTDVVMVANGRVCYWPNLGYGTFGRKVTMNGSPSFEHPDQFHVRWLRVLDVDGTGPADLVYFDGEGARVWFNQAGNGFSEPVRLSQFPRPHAMAHMEVADLLGRGTACLLWSSPLPAEHGLRYIDLFPEGKPYLLNQVDNGMGRQTRVQYGSSTEHYLRDRSAGRPWATRLPFPVQVIDRVEVVDHARGHRMVSTYAYHHGYFDGPEREFRGFGMVEQRDAETFDHFAEPGLFPTGWQVVENALHAAPVVTRSWFHTGAYLVRGDLLRQYETEYWQGDENAPDPLATRLPPGLRGDERREALRAIRGRPLRQEIYAEDGSETEANPYQVTEHAYVVRIEQKKYPTDPERLEDGRSFGVFFVHHRETRSFHYERNADDPRSTQILTLSVDAFGNVLRGAEVAYPRRVPTGPAQAEQGTAKVVIAENDWVNQDDPLDAPYRLGTPVETRSFELTGFAAPDLQDPWTVEDVDAMVDQATAIAFESEPDGQTLEKRLLSRTQARYWNDALTAALAHGQVGTRALVHETWRMAFSAARIADVLDGRLEGTALSDVLGQEGGYVSLDDAWWTRSERATFDDTRFYLPVTVFDPFGNETSIAYDDEALLVTRVTDAVANTIQVEHDYRVLQTHRISDPNGNRSFAAFDGLGRVTAVAIAGKDGETDSASQGDTLAHPTLSFVYDAFAWVNEQTPVFVHAFAREQYSSIDEAAPVQQTVTYSDGAGNVLMEKVLAQPGDAPARDVSGQLVFEDGDLVFEDTSPNPRWVGTGRTILDNKGNPVKQYEPFFSDRPDWETEEELVHFGVTPILHYDPLGRLIRTDHPDGTLEQVVFTPWRAERWDSNDTVLLSDWHAERAALAGGTAEEDAERRAAELAEAHADTPTVIHADVLGRDVVVVEHLRDDNDPPTDIFLETRTVLDISGNVRSVVNARGNTAQTDVPGMLGQVLHTTAPDTGGRWMLDDVRGAPLRLWDGLDRTHRFAYDDVRRLTHHFVQPDGGGEALVMLNVWGEVAPDAENENLRGRLIRQYDGAGLLENTRFHFAGHLLEQARRLTVAHDAVPDWSDLAEEATLGGLDTAAASLLEAQTYTTQGTYDALGRPVSRTTPDESVTRYTYDEGGLLSLVEANVRGAASATTFVDRIDYDVYGRRAAVVHGNGTTTAYAYDPRSFRLRRIHTTRASPANDLQDLRYTYDPVGNIVEIRDEADETVFFRNEVVEPEQRFEYDALYRLVRAEGREHVSQGQPIHSGLTPGSQPHPNDPAALRRYVEHYTYDDVGNLTEMRHVASGGNWTRDYVYALDGNRLLENAAPGDPAGGPFSHRYTYDAHGSMTSMPHLSAIDWDHADHMQHADLGGGGNVYFQYDAAGNRVRKVRVDFNEGQGNERVYVGDFELYRERELQSGELGERRLERETLHIADDTGRIVMVETLTIDEGEDITPSANLARYQHGNHLGTVALELDAAANVISYEEYHPYGTSAYRAVDSTIEVSAKRYRYIGRERDEETGLDHMGARYYAPWLGRWTAADPIGLGDGVNRYAYARENPVTLVDPGGKLAEPPQESVESRHVVVHSSAQENLAAREQELRKAEARLAPFGEENRRALQEALGPEGFANQDYDRDLVGALIAESVNISYAEREIAAERAQLAKERAEYEKTAAAAAGIAAHGPIVEVAGGVVLGLTALFVAAPAISALALRAAAASPGGFILLKEFAFELGQGEGGSVSSGRTAKVAVEEAKAARTTAQVAKTGATKGSAGAMRRLEYEPNPKHGTVARGKASPAPKNAQAALDTSIDITANSSRRVGIDYEEGEFVVFAEHLPGKFHGFVVPWKELTQKMQSALRKAGMADAKGRILTD